MGWLSNLLGTKPERMKEARNGFFWETSGVPALAAGRGWTQEVVGESFYRATLEKITRGGTVHGVLMDRGAEIVAGEYEGKPAVFVEIDGQRVGSIPKQDCAALHRELLTVAGERATVKGQVSAGYEGHDYCVKLSLARPLRLQEK